jgi:hypothetical protein
VLDLRNLPDLVQLSGLQSCSALRCMSVAGCSSLRLLNLAGLSGLRQLRIRECDELREVLGVTAALTRLVVADCERIREQDVSRAASALKRGDSLSDQGSLPPQPSDPEGAEVAQIEKVGLTKYRVLVVGCIWRIVGVACGLQEQWRACTGPWERGVWRTVGGVRGCGRASKAHCTCRDV